MHQCLVAGMRTFGAGLETGCYGFGIVPTCWESPLDLCRTNAMEAINNETLFAWVEARRALWQAKHKHHQNKHVTRCLWIEVAIVLMPNTAVTGKCSKFYTGVIHGALSIMIEPGRDQVSRSQLPLLCKLGINLPQTQMFSLKVI